MTISSFTLAITVATHTFHSWLRQQPRAGKRFTTLPTLNPDLSDPAALNQLTRTILDPDFRHRLQSSSAGKFNARWTLTPCSGVGYVGTKDWTLQTIDGNRGRCARSSDPH